MITGGTSGIGLAIAKRFAAQYDLALIYRENKERAQKACGELLESHPGAKVVCYAGDLSQPHNCKAVLDSVVSDFQQAPQSFIHCAGRFNPVFFLMSDLASVISPINEHLTSAVTLTHLVLPGMYRAREGRIVFLGSLAARLPGEGQAVYAAAKGALESFARGITREVHHRGVTVNCVAPGLIDTEMAQPTIQKLQAKNPSYLPGKPEDVASVVAFLCSKEAANISGETIYLHTGRTRT